MLLVGEDYKRIGREIKSLLGDHRLILASGSPRRQMILKELGLTYEVIFPDIAEHINSSAPDYHVQQYALEKAKAAANQVNSGIILAADTVVVLGNEILGKPKDRAEAFQMLNKLSGQTHTVFTGVAVKNLETDKEKVDFQTTRVTFHKLAGKAVDDYLDTKEFSDKAGAYGIQGMGNFLVKEIRGDLDNVIGLPLKTVKRLLQETL